MPTRDFQTTIGDLEQESTGQVTRDTAILSENMPMFIRRREGSLVSISIRFSNAVKMIS